MSSSQTRAQRRKRANTFGQLKTATNDFEVFQNLALKDSLTDIFNTFGPVVTAELQALQLTQPELDDEWDIRH